jgi:hypothetical protein
MPKWLISILALSLNKVAGLCDLAAMVEILDRGLTRHARRVKILNGFRPSSIYRYLGKIIRVPIEQIIQEGRKSQLNAQVPS